VISNISIILTIDAQNVVSAERATWATMNVGRSAITQREVTRTSRRGLVPWPDWPSRLAHSDHSAMMDCCRMHACLPARGVGCNQLPLHVIATCRTSSRRDRLLCYKTNTDSDSDNKFCKGDSRQLADETRQDPATYMT